MFRFRPEPTRTSAFPGCGDPSGVGNVPQLDLCPLEKPPAGPAGGGSADVRVGFLFLFRPEPTGTSVFPASGDPGGMGKSGGPPQNSGFSGKQFLAASVLV